MPSHSRLTLRLISDGCEPRQARLSDGTEPYIPAGRKEDLAVKLIAQASETRTQKVARLFGEILIGGLAFFGLGCMLFGAIEFFFWAAGLGAPQ